ncbi:MAG: PQQ-binding-like beta-propeller repeat protein, partial [Candidatus Thermoplasmatota archaeon]
MLKKIVLFCIISSVLLGNLQLSTGREAQKDTSQATNIFTNIDAKKTLSYQLTNQTIQILSNLKNVSVARANTYLYYYNPSDVDDSILHRLRRSDLILSNYTLVVLNFVKDSLDTGASAGQDLAQSILVGATKSSALALSVDCANLAILLVAFYYLIEWWKEYFIVDNITALLENNWNLIYLSDCIPLMRATVVEEAEFFNDLASGNISWELSAYKNITQLLRSDKTYLDTAVRYATTLSDFYGPMILNTTPGTPLQDRNNDGTVNESEDYRVAVPKFFERLKAQFEAERNLIANLTAEFSNVTHLPMPTAISILPSKFRIRENMTKTLNATLIDGNDLGISNKIVSWSATKGSFDTDTCVTNATGECNVIYTASEWGEVKITASFANETNYLGSSYKITGYVAPLWSLLPTSQWPKFGRDAQNTAQSPTSICWDIDFPLCTKWSYNMNATYVGRGVSSPIVAPDRIIYVASAELFNYTAYAFNFKLYALDFKGRLKWIYNMLNNATVSEVVDPIVRADGSVYAAAENNLYCINSAGNLIWNITTSGAIIYPPAIGWDGSIYVVDNTSMLYAINPNGTMFWSYSGARGAPVVDSDGNIYFITGGLVLYIVSLDMYGNFRWSQGFASGAHPDAVGPPRVISPAIDRNETVYVVSSFPLYVPTVHPTQLHAFDTRTGSLKWILDIGILGEFELPVFIPPPVISQNGKIYWGVCYYQGAFLGDSGTLYIINQNGSIYHAYNCPYYFTSPITTDIGGMFYVGYRAEEHGLLIGNSSRAVYNYKIGYIRAAPTLDSYGILYVIAEDTIYAIAKSDIDIVCIDSPVYAFQNDTINFSVIVKNVGVDIACNVTATISLPASISTSAVTQQVGDGILLPGEISVVTWELVGNKTWSGDIAVKVISDNGSDSGRKSITVLKEEEWMEVYRDISILDIDYPDRVRVGENFNLSFAIKNTRTPGSDPLYVDAVKIYLPEVSSSHPPVKIYLPEVSYAVLLSHLPGATGYYGISTQEPLDKIIRYYIPPNETVNISWNLTAVNKGKYTITLCLYYGQYVWYYMGKFVSRSIEVYDTTVLNVTYNNATSTVSVTTNVNFLNPV